MPETDADPTERPPIFPDDDLVGTGHPHPWPFLNTTPGEPMIGEIREYTLTCAQGQLYTVPLAKEIAPGLLVYRIPDGMHSSSPHRWRIGHEPSGRSVADAMRREDAVRGAELLGTLADWTQDARTLHAVLDPNELFVKLSYVDCIQPASEPMRGDVSNNGRYSEDDIREAAAEYKADGFNALEVLVDMSHTVPWMGLDTEAFNEAHDRIVRLAEAA
ncbi:hypothetical protein [Streptomyces lydicus]|uniref:hypothetical protein n=1 Tax=Streptomyces lydicus TaxID=47763 RepID=UPI0033348816